MEKKVPERKVSLREEDVFYVYDKRINKCIKEDCEGTVKYGLVLRVSMAGDETCNCFECNKCHMKYTPYPNYVRLTKTDMMTIYNKDEVDARDRKRAEDALKQAAKDRRKQQGQGRKFILRRDKEQGSEGRPYGRKSFDRRSYEKRPYDRDGFGKSYERKPYDKESYDKNSNDRRPYDRNEKKSFERKPYSKKLYDKESYEKKPYERKSYDQKPYERNYYSSRSYKSKPYQDRTQGAYHYNNSAK